MLVIHGRWEARAGICCAELGLLCYLAYFDAHAMKHIIGCCARSRLFMVSSCVQRRIPNPEYVSILRTMCCMYTATPSSLSMERRNSNATAMFDRGNRCWDRHPPLADPHSRPRHDSNDMMNSKNTPRHQECLVREQKRTSSPRIVHELRLE